MHACMYLCTDLTYTLTIDFGCDQKGISFAVGSVVGDGLLPLKSLQPVSPFILVLLFYSHLPQPGGTCFLLPAPLVPFSWGSCSPIFPCLPMSTFGLPEGFLDGRTAVSRALLALHSSRCWSNCLLVSYSNLCVLFVMRKSTVPSPEFMDAAQEFGTCFYSSALDTHTDFRILQQPFSKACWGIRVWAGCMGRTLHKPPPLCNGKQLSCSHHCFMCLLTESVLSWLSGIFIS